MPNQSQTFRALDTRTFNASAVQELDTVTDAGLFTQLNIHFRRFGAAASQASTIILQHAAVNEEGAYIDLDTTQFDLDGADSDKFVQVTAFLRFIRWKTTMAGGSSATVLIDVVAKQ